MKLTAIVLLINAIKIVSEKDYGHYSILKSNTLGNSNEIDQLNYWWSLGMDFKGNTTDFTKDFIKCINAGKAAASRKIQAFQKCLYSYNSLERNDNWPLHWFNKKKEPNCNYDIDIIHTDPLQLNIQQKNCKFPFQPNTNKSIINGGSSFRIDLINLYSITCDTKDFFNNTYISTCISPPIEYYLSNITTINYNNCSKLIVKLEYEHFDAFRELLDGQYKNTKWSYAFPNTILYSKNICKSINIESGKILDTNGWMGWSRNHYNSNEWYWRSYDVINHQTKNSLTNNINLYKQNWTYELSGNEISNIIGFPHNISKLHIISNKLENLYFIGASHTRYMLIYLILLSVRDNWKIYAKEMKIHKYQNEMFIPNKFTYFYRTETLYIIDDIQNICNNIKRNGNKKEPYIIIIDTGSWDLGHKHPSAILYYKYINELFDKIEYILYNKLCIQLYFIFFTPFATPDSIFIDQKGMRNNPILKAFSMHILNKTATLSQLYKKQNRISIINSFDIIHPFSEFPVCKNHYLCQNYDSITNTTLYGNDCSLLHKRNDLLWCPYDLLVTRAGDVITYLLLKEIQKIKTNFV